MANNITEIGFEKQIWDAADELRGSMDAAEYKHVVLGLIFLKYHLSINKPPAHIVINSISFKISPCNSLSLTAFLYAFSYQYLQLLLSSAL